MLGCLIAIILAKKHKRIMLGDRHPNNLSLFQLSHSLKGHLFDTVLRQLFCRKIYFHRRVLMGNGFNLAH
jgi:hypothetical protein